MEKKKKRFKMVGCAEEWEALQAHSALERWDKRRAAVERWKLKNRDYYLEQKRRLAARPEYLAKRRALYAARPKGARPNLSAQETLPLDVTENGEAESTAGDRGGDPRRSPTQGARLRPGAGAAGGG